MNKLIFIIIIFLSLSCKKENPIGEVKQNEDELFICSDCLQGEWELISGLKMIGNDTLQVFENNQINDFWYGVRESYKYDSHLFLTFSKNSFSYDQLVTYYINGGEEIIKYSDNFKWLNTSVSKTHLKIRMRGYPNNDVDIFKIKKLTSSELELEHYHGRNGNAAFFMNYKFKKKDSTQFETQNQERRIKQTPINLTGNWKLDEFSEINNDSVFTRFINDTLIYQNYQYLNRPPVLTKIIYKMSYGLTIKLEDFGVFNGVAWENGVSRNIVGYWYWTDEPNPHTKIYIQPTTSLVITDYDLIVLDNNTMSLQHKFQNDATNQGIFYKFKRQ